MWYVSCNHLIFDMSKVMWDRLVNVPLDQGNPKGGFTSKWCFGKTISHRSFTWWAQRLFVQGKLQSHAATRSRISKRRRFLDNGRPGRLLHLLLRWQEIFKSWISWSLPKSLASGKSIFQRRVESFLVIQDLVDGDKLQKPSLSITTRVVYEVGPSITWNNLQLLECLHLQWKDVTFVTSEIVGPTHSGVLLPVLQNGKYLWSKLELKQTGNIHPCSY